MQTKPWSLTHFHLEILSDYSSSCKQEKNILKMMSLENKLAKWILLIKKYISDKYFEKKMLISFAMLITLNMGLERLWIIIRLGKMGTRVPITRVTRFDTHNPLFLVPG